MIHKLGSLEMREYILVEPEAPVVLVVLAAVAKEVVRVLPAARVVAWGSLGGPTPASRS